jgi:hypothetical protein
MYGCVGLWCPRLALGKALGALGAIDISAQVLADVS